MVYRCLEEEYCQGDQRGGRHGEPGHLRILCGGAQMKAWGQEQENNPTGQLIMQFGKNKNVRGIPPYIETEKSSTCPDSFEQVMNNGKWLINLDCVLS